MDAKQALQLFRETGALHAGHFKLTSGLHSDTYFQCALVLQHPALAAKLCAAAHTRYRRSEVQTVIAPAVGGIVVGQEVARQLGARSIFAERQAGKMTLRRGFALQAGEKILVAEDVITTGGSVNEVIALARQRGAEVVGVFSIVDRSAGRVDFGVPHLSVVPLDVQTYAPDTCPLCARGVSITQPGSRNVPLS